MQILQRNRDEIMADLNRCLGSCNLSFQQLAEGSRLSYHAARRYLTSRYAKITTIVLKPCACFWGGNRGNRKAANWSVGWMTQTIHEVWDGSEPHAGLIVELIKSTKSFKVNQRQ